MTCTACPTPTATGIYLCENCADALYAALNDIPDVLADLEVTAAKQDAMGGPGGSGGYDSTPPAKLGALEASYRLRVLVNSWAGMLTEYDKRKTPPPSHPAATYLRRSVNEIRRHDWSGPMCDEIIDAVTTGSRLVDRPRDVRIFGRCEQALEENESYLACDGEIKADYDDPTAQCGRCGTAYRVAELIAEQRDKTRGELMTAAKARKYLRENAAVEVKAKDFENWVAHRHLPYVLARVTSNGPGRRLYYPGDVLRVHHRMQDRRIGAWA